MMYLLYIQSAVKPNFVKLINELGIVHMHVLSDKEKFAENILEIVSKLLKDSKINMSDITDIAYISGPGSFTGLRCGLSFVKGLAQGKDIKILPVNLLSLMTNHEKEYFPIISAGSERVFVLKDRNIRVELISNLEKHKKYVSNEIILGINTKIINILDIDIITYIQNVQNEIKYLNSYDLDRFYKLLPEYVLEPRIG